METIMPNETFNAQIPETTHATIVQLEAFCTYASGLEVYYTNGGNQLRVKLRDATQRVLLTADYQPVNRMFFCRAYAFPNRVIDAGVDRSRAKQPSKIGEPLRSEFHCTVEEFTAGIVKIVDFSYAPFKKLG
jgi:hypothetical protein